MSPDIRVDEAVRTEEVNVIDATGLAEILEPVQPLLAHIVRLEHGLLLGERCPGQVAGHLLLELVGVEVLLAVE